MRVLMVHNRYLETGGEDGSHAADVALLRDRGDHVDEWVEDNRRVAELGLLRAAGRTIWSEETRRAIRRRLTDVRYDLVWVQNFFPLVSPAVYWAARSVGVPLIQTIHNYRFLCVNALLYRNGAPCEDCVGKVPWRGVIHRCYRGSAAASATVATMLATHRLAGSWNQVDAFVALTEFAREKLVQGGLPEHRILVRSGFARDPGVGPGGTGALFVGRLSSEKGVELLLEAWKIVGDIPLRIVGTGPLEGEVRRRARDLPSVEVLGSRSSEEVLGLMKTSAALVVPSRTYEGFPRVIIEAYAVGLPVVAPDFGGMAAIVSDGVTGFHFRPLDVADLARAVRVAFADPAKLAGLRPDARRRFESDYTEERSYQTFLRIASFARTEAASR
jgi:glycosyltransferase involved in cell wall biosynthesis